MPEIKQYVTVCREDYWPMYQAVHKVLDEVMLAGEAQRIKKGLNPDGWMTSNALKRLCNVVVHVLTAHHHQNLNLLTVDTRINEWKHALCGLAIIAYLEAKPEEKVLEEAIDE